MTRFVLWGNHVHPSFYISKDQRWKFHIEGYKIRPKQLKRTNSEFIWTYSEMILVDVVGVNLYYNDIPFFILNK